MSLRHRLPLTYGLIALLAALALGAALLLILGGYYKRQESAYLQQNAEVIAEVVSGLSEDELIGLADDFATLAFLTQTRIRLADAGDGVQIDTGATDVQPAAVTLSLAVEAENIRQAFSQTYGADGTSGSQTDLTFGNDGQSLTISSFFSSTAPGGITQGTLATPLNFGVDSGSTARRSDQIARVVVGGAFDPYGGYVEVSEGPAFGDAVLHSVGIGLLVAGTGAVLLSTLVGAWISRRIAQPLVELTGAAQAMASGDLSARSSIRQADEIGQLATTFNDMAGQVEMTVEALQRFVADAAHEIQTPITALRTNLELMDDTQASAHYVAEAKQQTARLQGMTESLLQLSRLESAGNSAESTSPSLQRLDLSTLLRNRSEQFATRAEQKGQQFELAVTSEAKTIFVHSNGQQIQHVIDNLLDNAIKFSPAGALISASLRVVGTQAELTICDQGIGIDGEIARVFDRFHRAPNAAAYPGSGLGLAIVQRIVVAHGGIVEVTSAENETRFSVLLPLAD